MKCFFNEFFGEVRVTIGWGIIEVCQTVDHGVGLKKRVNY